MARKPKAQPSTATATEIPARVVAAMIEALPPARQGRKPKVSPPSPTRPVMTANAGGAPHDIKADNPDTGPVDAPRRKGPNRNATRSATAAATPLRQARTRQGRSATSRQTGTDAAPDQVKDNALDAGPASQPESAASADPVPADADPVQSGGDLQQSSPGLDVPAPTKPAAHWDRATDAVQFDWPEIERTAAQAGPNQGMAKLLVAARAEGANSRWPL